MKCVGDGTRVGVAALVFVISGCSGSDGGSSSSGGVVSNGTTTQTYSNGHPLRLSNSDTAVQSREDQVHSLVNNHRTAMGLNALQDLTEVRDVARAHSQHMILHSFFAHTNPEGDAMDVRLTRNAVAWTAAGENIAAGYQTAESVVNAWLNSQGHRANIESSLWTHDGVGYTESASSTYVWYWTHNFIRR